jgi:hypothetical protein
MKGIRAIPVGLVLLLVAAPALAAPVGPQLAVEAPTAVHKVHGSHRACRYSSRWDWWHRHVGRHRRAVDCGRRYYYYEEPYWYGPGITFHFGDRHRFHRRHRFDGPRRFHRGHRFRGGREGRRGRRH